VPGAPPTDPDRHADGTGSAGVGNKPDVLKGIGGKAPNSQHPVPAQGLPKGIGAALTTDLAPPDVGAGAIGGKLDEVKVEVEVEVGIKGDNAVLAMPWPIPGPSTSGPEPIVEALSPSRHITLEANKTLTNKYFILNLLLKQKYVLFPSSYKYFMMLLSRK
jgi:hypothetical protein